MHYVHTKNIYSSVYEKQHSRKTATMLRTEESEAEDTDVDVNVPDNNKVTAEEAASALEVRNFC